MLIQTTCAKSDARWCDQSTNRQASKPQRSTKDQAPRATEHRTLRRLSPDALQNGARQIAPVRRPALQGTTARGYVCEASGVWCFLVRQSITRDGGSTAFSSFLRGTGTAAVNRRTPNAGARYFAPGPAMLRAPERRSVRSFATPWNALVRLCTLRDRGGQVSHHPQNPTHNPPSPLNPPYHHD